jgi:hypothetical protein
MPSTVENEYEIRTAAGRVVAEAEDFDSALTALRTLVPEEGETLWAQPRCSDSSEWSWIACADPDCTAHGHGKREVVGYLCDGGRVAIRY